MAGRVVHSSGAVTSVGARVATVQDTVGDGDPATSDAVMLVVPPGKRLRAGDRIEFTGTVTEHVPGGERTANLSVTTVERARLRVVGHGALPHPVVLGARGREVPAAVIISADELPVNLRRPGEARSNRFDPDADALDFLESLEGMRVTIPAPVAVSALQTFSPRSRELFVLPDGARWIAAGRRTRAGGILLQSGPENRGSQNPERLQIQLDAALLPASVPEVTVGDALGEVTGVLRYDYGNYELAATAPIEVRRRFSPPASTRLTKQDGWLTVATYNVLNLSAGPEDSMQRALLGRQIAGPLGAPEIIALQEIQDASGELDDGTTDAAPTLAALIAAIRAAGGPSYRGFDVAPQDGRPGGVPGGNIRNAYLYDPARVTLVGFAPLTPARLAQAGAEPADVFHSARDPLLADFDVGERRITLINNHLTSRFGSTPTYGAIQPFVQAGAEARAGQIRALRAYVADLLRRRPEARVVVLGDMNTFEFTHELADVLPGDPPLLYSLTWLVPQPDRYTYNYEGNSQVLDHVFVTEALRDGAEAEMVHLNVDFPSAPGHVASDHDPVVIRLRR